MLTRPGLWLSVLTIIAIEALAVFFYFVDGQHEGSNPDLGSYLVIGLLVYWPPTLAVIWLGLFVTSVIRKAMRLSREP